MNIYILSSGRASRQITWNNLPQEVRAHTEIVVPWDEVNAYKYVGFRNILSNPAIVRDVTATRQWLVENCPHPYMCMLDDDLRFAVRNRRDLSKFLPASEEDIARLFNVIEAELHNYNHVGVRGREGANRDFSDFLYDCRMVRILAYDVTALRRMGIRYDRLKFMADFDVTLQLLRAGWSNCVINYMVQDQAGSNAEGGCSQYRTKELQEADAYKLAELHPGLVRTSIKKTKSGGMWAERTDVTCYWKKARESSK